MLKALAKCSFSLTSKTISITWHKSEAAGNPKSSAEPEKLKVTEEIPSNVAAESTEEAKSETVQNSTTETNTTNTTTETVESTATATEATERDPVDALFDSSGNSSGNAENLVPGSIASES